MSLLNMLLNNSQLERSSVVANCLMNRERGAWGANSYAKELGFNPVDYLKQRLSQQATASWLDLCCGAGNALIQATEHFHKEGLASRVRFVGVDLVRMFSRYPREWDFLELKEASLSDWRADQPFDLITCVHGLHYIGDKLEVIKNAVSWLTDDGMFVAHIDLANLKFVDGKPAGRSIMADLRRAGLTYNPKRRLLTCKGQRRVILTYDYLGADDHAGPNYTRQEAVDSYYRKVTQHERI